MVFVFGFFFLFSSSNILEASVMDEWDFYSMMMYDAEHKIKICFPLLLPVISAFC